jgi:hypothetical protein
MTKGSLDERTIRRKSLPTVETRTLSLFSSSFVSMSKEKNDGEREER